MGKKVKKDEKATAEDTFDPLLFESRQAETVVLMLDSPEEEVQMKACQAIYKFIGKCDENKDLLFKLNVIAKLHLLMKSEDKTVRRDAVMVMGVLTENDLVKKSVRNEGRMMKIFLQLLSQEEHATTNEFAAMALTNLCNEYTSINQLLENNGVSNLVECLLSDDPDVQKNSITCLDLVLRDIEARPLLKLCDGLSVMIDLLKSEYPVIQENALKALSKAVLDGSVRAALREMECINRFIDIIGNPEYNDLHKMALQVIAALLEDIECVKQMKETNGLTRLIAFIGDASPPEEEQKERPKKSSKSGSAKKKKEKEEDKPKEYVASATMPEVKIQACKAIMRASQLDDVRKILHDCDVERLLTGLLSHEIEGVRVAAASAIGVISRSSLSQTSFLEQGAVELLVKMMKSEHKDLRESVLIGLANLTMGNLKICQEVASKHGLEHLIASLAFTHEGICSNALVSISNMSTDEVLRTKLLGHGLVKALIAPLKSQSTIVQTKAALAVAGFLLDGKSRNDLRKHNGIQPLAALLLSANNDVRRAACWAVTVVANDTECAELLAQEGALNTLQELNKSETKRNKFTEAALNRLFDSNLNLKYALTGYLDFTDQISDIFYDCGQHKPGSTLLTLEQYCLEPINAKRPIILVNLTAQKPMTPTNSILTDTDDKKSDNKLNNKKKSSKNKKERKSSAVHESAPNLDGSVEDQELNQSGTNNNSSEVLLEMPFKSVPHDPGLLKLVEDVIETIGPKESVEIQISELAKFVSDQMGGPIPHKGIMSVPYELHLSQLKTQLESNIIPISSITLGINVHRALLFKCLADRLYLPTNLHRGDYNRSWNEIWIFSKDKSPKSIPKLCIVDLMHCPGKLLPKDSVEGHAYIRL